MGYDFHQVKEHPQYKAAKEERQRLLSNIDAHIEALKARGADGSWLTEFEEQVLSPDEQTALRKERLNEWNQAWRQSVDRDTAFDWAARRDAILRAQTRPATEEYISAVTERDDLHRKTTPHDEYFRLNNFGMRRYAGIMAELGMLKETRPEDEPWPEHSDELDDELREALDEALDEADSGLILTDPKKALTQGLQSDGWKEYYGPDGDSPVSFTEAQVDLFVTHRKATTEHLRKHDPSIPGIERIKFSSNDGWWVTKEECQSAVEVWEALPETTRGEVVEKMGDYWLEWIEYLRDGASTNGLTVH